MTYRYEPGDATRPHTPDVGPRRGQTEAQRRYGQRRTAAARAARSSTTARQQAQKIINDAADWLDAHPTRWTRTALARWTADGLPATAVERNNIPRLLADPDSCFCAEGIVTAIAGPSIYHRVSLTDTMWTVKGAPVAEAITDLLGCNFYTFNDRADRTPQEVAAELRYRADNQLTPTFQETK